MMIDLVVDTNSNGEDLVSNDTASANAIPPKTSGSRPVVADTLPRSPTFSAPDEDKLALVATLAPYPRCERILKQLSRHAEGLGYEVFFSVAVAVGDGELIYPHGGGDRARDTVTIFMDDSPASETALALAAA